MSTVTPTRVLRPVPTLLGGSGRARASLTQSRPLPALLKPAVVIGLPSGIAAC